MNIFSTASLSFFPLFSPRRDALWGGGWRGGHVRHLSSHCHVTSPPVISPLFAYVAPLYPARSPTFRLFSQLLLPFPSQTRSVNENLPLRLLNYVSPPRYLPGSGTCWYRQEEKWHRFNRVFAPQTGIGGLHLLRFFFSPPPPQDLSQKNNSVDERSKGAIPLQKEP